MRRKWARVLAAALAVTLAVPTNLPANAQAAKIVDNDSATKQANESISQDYSYAQIGDSDFYLRYISDYAVNPGQTVDMTTTIVKRGDSYGNYTVVADQTGYTYAWEREMVEDGDFSGTWVKDTTNTTNALKADSDESWFAYDNDYNKISRYRLKVSTSSNSVTVYMDVELDLPYTLSDSCNAYNNDTKIMGEKVVFDTGIEPDAGYTVSYEWKQYQYSNGSFASEAAAPASNNTSTTAGKYEFILTKEADYGTYVCTFTLKEATTSKEYSSSMQFTVTPDTGLRLYNTDQTYRRALNGNVTFALDGLSYDTSAYKLKYVWYKDGEKLAHSLDNYTIPVIQKESFGTYECELYLYKITATAAEMETDAYLAYRSKTFRLVQTTGLWAYSGEDEIKVQAGNKVSMQAFASNLDATNYPITYKWYESKYNEENEEYEWTEIAGQVTATYNIDQVTTNQFGTNKYKCVVSDGVATKELLYSIYEDYGWKVNTPSENVLYKNQGETAELKVDITSAANYPITYTWYKADDLWSSSYKVISGATANTLSITLAKDEDFTTYKCVATNGKNDEYGDSCSKTILFKVKKNDNFYVEAMTYGTQYKKLGSSATFKVRPHSDDAATTFDYAWYFTPMKDFDNEFNEGGKRMPGQVSDTLTVSNIAFANYGRYSVSVTNNKTGDYEYFNFYLYPLSNVSLDYATESVLIKNPGEAVSMGVVTNNPAGEAVTYKWAFTPEDGNETTLDLYTGATLDIAALQEGQYGRYTCYALVNDSAVDSIDFVIKKDTKEYLEVEASTDQDQKVAIGEGFTLGVTATSKAGRTITYQWYNYDGAIYGATASTYTVAAARKSDFRTYWCVVQDGEEVSGKIYFFVSQKTATTFRWAGGTEEDAGNVVSVQGTVGKSQKLTITMTEDPNYPSEYQWYYVKDGEYVTTSDMIADANANEYTIASIGKDTVGYYACRVTNAVNTYWVYYYVYFNTGLKITATKGEYEAALGEKVAMTAKVTSNKKYPATCQWYFYNEDYEYLDEDGDHCTGKYVPISGATTSNYTIEALTKDNVGEYKLEAKTDGEIISAYFVVSEKEKLSIEKVKSSTDATLPGSQITLTGTVDAPKDVAVEYQWYVEDAVTGDYKRAKTASGKNAATAKVTVKAPSKIVPDSAVSDEYEYINYKLRAKAVIEGKTITATYSYPIMVVNPTYSTKAPQSAHNYKTERVSVYGYKAAANVATIKATFSKKTSINKDGDYLYVIDGKGKSSKYYGTELQKKTVSLSGNKFAVVLVSNNKDAKNYGFAVSKIKTSTSSATPSKLTLGVKEKHTIKGILTASQAKKAKYTTSKKKVAVVSKKGVITAKKTGKAKITIKVNKKKVKTITVTVKKAPKKVKVAKKKVTIKRGKSASVKYSLKPANVASYSMSIANAKALKKAKVSAYVYNGKVTITVGKKAKKKTYKVQVATYNKKKATIKVKAK